jgi:hypothetical protein
MTSSFVFCNSALLRRLVRQACPSPHVSTVCSACAWERFTKQLLVVVAHVCIVLLLVSQG